MVNRYTKVGLTILTYAIVASGPTYAQSVEKKTLSGVSSIKERDCDRVQVTLAGKLVGEIKLGEAVILTKPNGQIFEKCTAYPGGGTGTDGAPCSLAIVQFRLDSFLDRKWVLDIICYE